MALFAKFDVSFPDDPKVIEAGDLAELLYVRCVLKCKEQLTDGVIHRSRLARWAAGIRGKPAVHAERLVAVGLWEEHPDGWRIPDAVWRRWNSTREEVDATRAAKAEAGVLGNHRRWHAEEPSDDCRYCIADRSQEPIVTGSHGDRKSSPEPEPEPEPEPSSLRTRRCRIPNSLALDDRLTAVAIRRGMPTGAMPGEFQRFRDHHAAKGTLMIDWAAAWGTWCGNWRKFNPGAPNGDQPRRLNGADMDEAWRE